MNLLKTGMYAQATMLFGVVAIALSLLFTPFVSSAAVVYEQGFETDTADWFDSNSAWAGLVTRVASGDAGITSASGDWHAVFEGSAQGAPFSRFDQYRDVWPGDWVAEVDVYLDPAWAAETGFDYSVAANGSDNTHKRDFIFHVGVVSGEGLLVNASNNADFVTNPFKLLNDNNGNYYEVTEAGWYTLQHVFRDDAGVLAVDLNLVDDQGTVLWSATRSNPADLIPAVIGGNRYAWFTHIDVPAGIAVDNHTLSYELPFEPTLVITAPAENEVVSGVVDFAATLDNNGEETPLAWAVRADTCEANDDFTVAGNVGGFATPYDWVGGEFTASVDMSSLPDGEYCLVINPTDLELRETRTFTLSTPVPPEPVTGIEIIADGVSLGCSAYVNERSITVNWDDATDPNFAYYEYQADQDQVAPYDFTTTTTASERSGDIRDEDGTYHYRVRAVSTDGLFGEWSDWCSVTLDRQAPVVTIDTPADGAVVSGTVSILGTIAEETAMGNHNVALYDAGVDVNDFSLRLADNNVANSSVFTNQEIWSLDTTAFADGEYQLRFAARDAAGNRDLSDPETGGTTSVHVITLFIENEVALDPVDKNQCKDGGFESFGFKNQGKCVQFVNTGKDSR